MILKIANFRVKVRVEDVVKHPTRYQSQKKNLKIHTPYSACFLLAISKILEAVFARTQQKSSTTTSFLLYFAN